MERTKALETLKEVAAEVLSVERAISLPPPATWVSVLRLNTT